MNKNLKVALLIVLASAVGSMTGYCGMVALLSGSVAILQQETKVNLEFDYDGMRVGKFIREEDYLAKKVAEYNQKEAGRGDRWRQAWITDRTQRFQPKFTELLNKYVSSKNGNLQFGPFKDAKYTLLLKTTFTEPGWNVGVMRHPAFINCDAMLVETQNRGKIVAALTITKSPGNPMWNDYDTGERIQESYAKAGKELGIFIAKKLR
jgi:hypothetical protein